MDDQEPQDTPEDLEWQAAATDAMIEQAHREQVERMADLIEAAILAALDGFPWRRSLLAIDDACRLAASRFRQEAAASPPPKG
jgi:hypothetical protein